MNNQIPLDRLAAFAISSYAHTTTTRNNPAAMSAKAFERHRNRIRDFIKIDLSESGSGVSLGERFYERFSPLANNKPFGTRTESDRAYWEAAAKEFLNQIVLELEHGNGSITLPDA